MIMNLPDGPSFRGDDVSAHKTGMLSTYFFFANVDLERWLRLNFMICVLIGWKVVYCFGSTI